MAIFKLHVVFRKATKGSKSVANDVFVSNGDLISQKFAGGNPKIRLFVIRKVLFILE